MTTAPVADGRSARSAKTRDAIADALLDLLTEGNLRPTAKEIAERAGVSVRSVYVHFDDLEDLFCVAANRHFERVAPMFEPLPVSGTVEERAVALVRRRVRIYTKLGSVGRATQLQAPFSPTLQQLVRDAYARSRAELERTFGPELDRVDVRERSRRIALLDLLTGFAAWETLHEGHDLSVEDATTTMVAAVVDWLGDNA